MGLIQVEKDIWLPDRALNFGSATTDNISIAATASLNTPSQQTGIMLVRPSSFAGGFILMGRTNDVATVNVFGLNGAQNELQLVRRQTGGTCQYVTNNLKLQLFEWRWLAFTYDDSATPRAHVYSARLGQPFVEATYGVASDSTLGLLPETLNPFFLANRPTLTASWAGRIATIGFVGSILPLAHLNFAMRDSMSLRSASQFLFLLGDNNTGTPIDLSRNANVGTLTGGTQESGPAQDYLQRNPSRSVFLMPLLGLEMLRERKNEIWRTD